MKSKGSADAFSFYFEGSNYDYTDDKLVAKCCVVALFNEHVSHVPLLVQTWTATLTRFKGHHSHQYNPVVRENGRF